MCSICTHLKSKEIEEALLEISGVDSSERLEELATKYKVNCTELKEHALLHCPVGVESNDSLVRQIKLKEADLLLVAANEYAVTLQNVGARINKAAKNDDIDVKFERMLTKAVVDLYIGCGGEIRNTVKTIAEINQMVNGPKDSGASGLEALAQALRGSGGSGG